MMAGTNNGHGMREGNNAEVVGRQPARRRMLIDSIVLSKPSLDLLVSLTNIISYYIQCIEAITGGIEQRSQSIEAANRCLDSCRQILSRRGGEIPSAVRRMASEFTMEAEILEPVLNEYAQSRDELREDDRMFLYAKSYTLRYIMSSLVKAYNDMRDMSS
jgi:hypothetical protein